MTTTNGLNTLEYAERLIRAGVPEEQAKAQALVLYEIINSNLATKRDLKDVDLKIEQVRADLKKDITIIMGSYCFLILGTLVTLAKFELLTPTP